MVEKEEVALPKVPHFEEKEVVLPKLSNFMCASLKTGTLIIGSLNLVASLIGILISVYLIVWTGAKQSRSEQTTQVQIH